jgi:hypothetical protein
MYPTTSTDIFIQSTSNIARRFGLFIAPGKEILHYFFLHK